MATTAGDRRRPQQLSQTESIALNCMWAYFDVLCGIMRGLRNECLPSGVVGVRAIAQEARESVY